MIWSGGENICGLWKYNGPYSRKRTNFKSPGLNLYGLSLVFVILINVKIKVSPGLIQD